MREESKNVIGKICLVTGVSVIISILVLIALSTLFPNESEFGKRVEQERSWLNDASCTELKEYIVFNIENNPSDSHFHPSMAKELYEWKCNK